MNPSLSHHPHVLPAEAAEAVLLLLAGTGLQPVSLPDDQLLVQHQRVSDWAVFPPAGGLRHHSRHGELCRHLQDGTPVRPADSEPDQLEHAAGVSGDDLHQQLLPPRQPRPHHSGGQLGRHSGLAQVWRQHADQEEILQTQGETWADGAQSTLPVFRSNCWQRRSTTHRLTERPSGLCRNSSHSAGVRRASHGRQCPDSAIPRGKLRSFLHCIDKVGVTYISQPTHTRSNPSQSVVNPTLSTVWYSLLIFSKRFPTWRLSRSISFSGRWQRTNNGTLYFFGLRWKVLLQPRK